MKNKKRNGTTKPAKGFRVGCIISLLALSVLLTIFVIMPRLKNKIDAEHVIVGKINNEQVGSRFTPVEIYRLDKESAYFAGSGSLFVGSEGEQIVTSEHLFRKEFGNATFAFRKLRPLEPEITHGINAILHKGTELAVRSGELPDIVIVKCGVTNLISCYSDRTLLVRQDQGNVSRIDEITTARSIVSGESVQIVGVLKSAHDVGTQYVILEYASIGGESGTGFVDAHDRLYVLKGIPDWPNDVKAQVEKLLSTTQALSVAYGPLQFRE